MTALEHAINEKHLEMIQGVINRLASNSFAVKTWAVGLIAAIFALAAEKTGGQWLLLVALLPIVAFGALDAYYLKQERLFRHLYVAVIGGKVSGPFSMDVSRFVKEKNVRWRSVFRSPAIEWLYGPLAVLALTVFAIVLWLRGGY